MIGLSPILGIRSTVGLQAAEPFKSFLLNGVDEYGSGGTAEQFNFSHTDPFTIMGYYKRLNNVTTHGLVYRASTVIVGGEINFGVVFDTSNRLVFNCQKNNANRSLVRMTGNVATGSWFHWAITRAAAPAASGMNMYINGQLQAKSILSDTLSVTPAHVSPLIIGARRRTSTNTNLTGFWDGNKADYRFFNKECSLLEIQEAYNLQKFIAVADLSYAGNIISSYRLGNGDVFTSAKDGHGGVDLIMVNTQAQSIVTDSPYT